MEPITEFKFNSIQDNSYILIIGKANNTGKSQMTELIMSTNLNIPKKIIISEQKSNYIEKYPDAIIYYEYKSDIIKDLLAAQKGNKNKAIMLFDNCLHPTENLMTNDELMKKLVRTGMHYKITTVIGLLCAVGYEHEFLTNPNYVFLFAVAVAVDGNITKKQKLYETYSPRGLTFDIFDEIFTKLTSNNGCMVICQKAQNKISWYNSTIDQHARDAVEQFLQLMENKSLEKQQAPEKHLPEKSIEQHRLETINDDIFVNKLALLDTEVDPYNLIPESKNIIPTNTTVINENDDSTELTITINIKKPQKKITLTINM